MPCPCSILHRIFARKFTAHFFYNNSYQAATKALYNLLA
ncbi:Hypothetical protein BN2458_PEG1290 [Helicobacter typhlonius]|uniref:Uncharacterized protein n=1 Tax=Helicobacter typhlonius TaxID=76936 RepID=A0A0S4PV22_9HELI|nr:Hypothetical protein BN2458_PEG1290 [Helicobacter typhlonius]